MKKGILFGLIACLIISVSFAMNVQREMPPAADFGEQIEVTFTINPEGVQNFEFTDTVPSNWEFVSWSVQGIPEENIIFSQHAPGIIDTRNTIYKWVFENSQGPITLSYTIIVRSVGEVNPSAVWIYNEEIGTESSEIFVRAVGVVCGDGICQSAYGENFFNCPEDCPFHTNTYFWVSLLLLATIIIITGTLHKRYKQITGGKIKHLPKPPATKIQSMTPVKKPEKTIHFEIKEKTPKAPIFPKLPVFKEKEPAVKKVKTKSKALAKKPKKSPRRKPSIKKTRKTAKKPTKRKTAKKSTKRKPLKKSKKTAKKTRKTAKKPVKTTKKLVRKDKHEKFYKDTLSRLEKIKKELK